ncbi:uncharacterized protein [Miscanthus floridulus]|uniref:uncharacterized protein isoform X2 n=1 Tax=Miscanthus floridulus TaxID=154761 RepID=UPI0034579F4F
MNNAVPHAAGPRGSASVRIPAPCRSSRGRGGQSGVRADAEGMARKSMCVSCSMRQMSSRSRRSAACLPSSTPRDMGSTRRRSRRASMHCRCPPSAKYVRSLPCLAAKFKSESFVQQCGGKSGDTCKLLVAIDRSTDVVSFLSVRQWRWTHVHAADISHWDAALQQVHVYYCREKAGFQPRHNSWIDELVGSLFQKSIACAWFLSKRKSGLCCRWVMTWTRPTYEFAFSKPLRSTCVPLTMPRIMAPCRCLGQKQPPLTVCYLCRGDVLLLFTTDHDTSPLFLNNQLKDLKQPCEVCFSFRQGNLLITFTIFFALLHHVVMAFQVMKQLVGVVVFLKEGGAQGTQKGL